MQKKVLAALVASVMAGQAMAITVVDDGTNTFTFGGHVGARYNTDDNSVNGNSIRGDSSRINFGFEHKLNEVTTAFAKVEWGFDITDDNMGDGFLTNRLGYVGVMNEQLGTVVFGKAWSSYGKVAGWTDSFAAAPASGSASGYYGEDGDDLGTARADDVLQYSYSRMGLNLSLQTQLGKPTLEEATIGQVTAKLARDSSYGISASYDLPMGLSFGAAYNQADVSGRVADNASTAFVDGSYKATSTVAGIKFEADKIYAAFTYSDLENRYVDDVLFADATGMELYASYQLNETIKVEGGYVQLDGENADGEDMNTEIKAMPVGVVYTQGPVQLSATYQYEKGKTAGKDNEDTAVLQARYYF